MIINQNYLKGLYFNFFTGKISLKEDIPKEEVKIGEFESYPKFPWVQCHHDRKSGKIRVDELLCVVDTNTIKTHHPEGVWVNHQGEIVPQPENELDLWRYQQLGYGVTQKFSHYTPQGFTSSVVLTTERKSKSLRSWENSY